MMAQRCATAGFCRRIRCPHMQGSGSRIFALRMFVSEFALVRIDVRLANIPVSFSEKHPSKG